MRELAEVGDVQASILLRRNGLIRGIGVSIGIEPLLSLGDDRGLDFLKSPLEPVHLVRGLVLVDKVLGQGIFGVGVMVEVYVGDVLELFLLTEVGVRRVAWILFEVADVFLVIGDDHLFRF